MCPFGRAEIEVSDRIGIPNRVSPLSHLAQSGRFHQTRRLTRSLHTHLLVALVRTDEFASAIGFVEWESMLVASCPTPKHCIRDNRRGQFDGND
jgi:hypothetical protein